MYERLAGDMCRMNDLLERIASCLEGKPKLTIAEEGTLKHADMERAMLLTRVTELERDQANAENRDGAANVQIDSLKRQLANARDQRKAYANLIEHIKTSIEAATDSDLEVM